MSTRYCVERIPLGSRGLRYIVVDSFSGETVALFKPNAPLDPAQCERALKEAGERCKELNLLDSTKEVS